MATRPKRLAGQKIQSGLGLPLEQYAGDEHEFGYGISQKSATDNAAKYAAILSQQATTGLPNAAAQTDFFADWQVAQGDAALAAGDVELALRWYAAADRNYAKAQDDRDSIPLFIEAATVAGQYTWRLPTQTEAETAIANRLFTYGDGGFNGYDGSPYVGFQEPWNSLCWTSTLSKSKKEASVFRPDGDTGWVTVDLSQVSHSTARSLGQRLRNCLPQSDEREWRGNGDDVFRSGVPGESGELRPLFQGSPAGRGDQLQ